MDVEIIDEDENPMLHRTDVRFQLTHDEATPSRLSVRDSLAAKLNKDSSEVVIKRLDTKYGMRKTVGYAKVYETADHALAVEQDHSLARNKIATDGEGAVAEVESEESDEVEAEEETEAVDEAADEAESENEPEGTDEPEAESENESEATDEAEADEEDGPEAADEAEEA